MNTNPIDIHPSDLFAVQVVGIRLDDGRVRISDETLEDWPEHIRLGDHVFALGEVDDQDAAFDEDGNRIGVVSLADYRWTG